MSGPIARGDRVRYAVMGAGLVAGTVRRLHADGSASVEVRFQLLPDGTKRRPARRHTYRVPLRVLAPEPRRMGADR